VLYGNAAEQEEKNSTRKEGVADGKEEVGVVPGVNSFLFFFFPDGI